MYLIFSDWYTWTT